jgi:ABC-type Zn uptake system ZnuABC Zn-binding protein ZnuA
LLALLIASAWEPRQLPALLGETARADGPIRVVTTSTDLEALVEAVGGDHVRVVSLAPPIHEPHQVEVKPRQLAELRAATLLVRIGLDHEPWLARVVETANDPRFAAGGPGDLDVSRGIALLQTETPRVRGERGGHVHGFGNTHYWLDPENARPITAAILRALVGLDPADAGVFEKNRARFLADLDARLARWTRAMAPYRGTRVVVVHETWPYFAERFGLVVVAALEPTPGVPPAASSLASLLQRMKDTKVRLLLAGPESDQAMVDQVATRSGARAVVLIPSVGGDPAARDYLSLFDVNIARLTEALAASR